MKDIVQRIKQRQRARQDVLDAVHLMTSHEVPLDTRPEVLARLLGLDIDLIDEAIIYLLNDGKLTLRTLLPAATWDVAN